MKLSGDLQNMYAILLLGGISGTKIPSTSSDDIVYEFYVLSFFHH